MTPLYSLVIGLFVFLCGFAFGAYRATRSVFGPHAGRFVKSAEIVSGFIQDHWDEIEARSSGNPILVIRRNQEASP